MAVAGVLTSLGAPSRAAAEALLLVDAQSGKVLHAEKATYPWYPASVTKLMTLYLTLKSLKEGRVTSDTLFTVSPNAMAQQPSKMGFPVGTQVTVDNALKMMMVHSANDMAVVFAEGLDGSRFSLVQECLELGEGLLDGVQIGRVFGEEDLLGAGSSNGLSGRLAFKRGSGH